MSTQVTTKVVTHPLSSLLMELSLFDTSIALRRPGDAAAESVEYVRDRSDFRRDFGLELSVTMLLKSTRSFSFL